MSTTRYYLVQVEWEYIADNYGTYTLLKTEAGRVRLQDKEEMEKLLEFHGVDAELVPTSYKTVLSPYIEPDVWGRHRRELERRLWG